MNKSKKFSFSSSNSKTSPLQVIPMGGVGEIGKNMFLIRYEDEMIILDAGLAFPEDEMLGIDIVIPDITYVLENKAKVKGIILTHGHEDHIGSMPFIIPRLNVPIWGTKLTLGMLKAKLTEYPRQPGLTLHEIVPESKINITKNINVEFFRTNHSIPDSVGVIINTPAGIAVYTSDFKFDQTPVNNLVTDYHKLSKLGNQDVLVMLSDSTNSDHPGYTPSEREVGLALDEIFRLAKGRILLATFASNIHRIQQAVDAALKYNRKIAITGRSIENTIRISRELGYLNLPEQYIIDVDHLNRYEPDKITLLTTGSQGEPMSALNRLSNNEHKHTGIVPGDTVIISASPIPGNEKMVFRTIDNLCRKGAEVVVHPASGVHVSGHGCEEEIKMMINLVRPRYIIPVHGEYRHMVQHANIAEKLGIPRDNVMLVENGTIMEFTGKTGRVAGHVQAGKILVDGRGIGDVGNVVLRDRQSLSQDGIVIVVITMTPGQVLMANPEIVTRGFVYVRESEGLLEDARDYVEGIIQAFLKRKNNRDWNSLRNDVRDGVNRFFWDKTGRRPMILPVIIETFPHE